MLSSIRDNQRGRVITYDYGLVSSAGLPRLYSISYKKLNANGTYGAEYKKISISYQSMGGGYPTSIESSNGERCVLSYENGLSSIVKYSTVDKIPSGSSVGSTEENIISTLSIQCTSQPYQTVITDEDGNKEVYRFSNEKLLSEYYQEINGCVAIAEHYEYTPYEMRKTVKATRESLNKKSFAEYIFEAGETSLTALNIYNNPVSTEVSGIAVTPTSSKTLSTEYVYDEFQRCEKEIQTETYSNGSTFTYVTRKYYNENSSLLKTIRYVQGEEATTGLTAEEYAYDDCGNITTVKQYKKICASDHPAESEYDFDSSSTTTIFYSEREYKEQGRIVEEKDETGSHITSYQYIDGTKLIEKVTNPDNSNIEYAFDSEDRIIEMSSTINGFENANYIKYTAGEIIEVDFSGNSDYLNYEYDKKRRVTAVKLGTDVYQTITYEDKVSENGAVVDKALLTNAKNEKFKVVIDRAGTFQKGYYQESDETAETLILEKTFDEYGQMTHALDHLSGEEVNITYDSVGAITEYESVCNGETYKEYFTYSARGELTKVEYRDTDGGRTNEFTYESNATGNLTTVNTGDFICSIAYDNYNRQVSEIIKDASNKIIESKNITYRKEDDHATYMVNELIYNNNSRITYKYDTRGNIKKVTQNELLVAQYKYDGLNRLIREDNQVFGETYLYTYDSNGNILSKELQPFTTAEIVAGTGTVTSYFYNEKNQLQSCGGQPCTYDAVGNPTSYRGETLTWTRGRKLVSYGNVQFAYDAQGKRLSKNTTKYYYNSANELIASSDGMEYFYGGAGLIGFVYGGQQYVYRKNLQGDIIAILDSNGTVVVQYVYDAWGESLVLDAEGNEITSASHVGQLNPFRYRGYFYDVETGLYYLQSRYYDPEMGRFLNMDSVDYADPETLNGLNLYAYCNNNPIMHVDPTGHFVLSVWMVGALIGFGVSFVSSLVSQALVEQKLDWEMVGIAAIDGVFGGISGALGVVLGPVSSVFVDVVCTAVNSFLTTGISNDWHFDNSDWIAIAGSTMASLVFSGISTWKQMGIDKTNVYKNAADAINMAKDKIAARKNGLKIKTKNIRYYSRKANKLIWKAYGTFNAYLSYMSIFTQSLGGNALADLF